MRDSTNIPETWQHAVDWRSCQNIVFLFVRDSLALVQYCLNRAETLFRPCTTCTHHDTAVAQLPQSQRDDGGRPEQPSGAQRNCHGLLMQVSELQFFTEQMSFLWHKKAPKFCISFWKYYHWWANLLREEIQIWKISHSSSKRETYLGEIRYAEENDSCS